MTIDKHSRRVPVTGRAGMPPGARIGIPLSRMVVLAGLFNREVASAAAQAVCVE
jgi:hypothetical protein